MLYIVVLASFSLAQFNKESAQTAGSQSVEDLAKEHLLNACSRGLLDEVKKAIAAGASIEDSRDGESGNTPLMWAAYYGHEKIASFLIKKGANVDALSLNGLNFALLLASFRGHRDIVELLLKRGANVDLQNKRGDTALSAATYMNRGDVVKLLISRWPEANLKSKDKGFSSLHISCHKGHYDIAKLIIGAEGDVDLQDDEGNTPAIVAAGAGHKDIVILLDENGADFSIANKFGQNPLMMAVHRNHFNVASYLLLEDVSADINIHAVDFRGNSALHYASAFGYHDHVELLLSKGFNIHLANEDGETPITLAKNHHHAKCLALLLSENKEEVSISSD